jgi:hypothetical protein
MTTLEINRLIVDRKRECGMGLCGSCEAIARWLFREHNVVTSTSWIAHVIKESGIK